MIFVFWNALSSVVAVGVRVPRSKRIARIILQFGVRRLEDERVVGLKGGNRKAIKEVLA